MNTAALVQQSIETVLVNSENIFPAHTKIDTSAPDYNALAADILSPLQRVGINHTLPIKYLLQLAGKTDDITAKGRIYLAIEARMLAQNQNVNPLIESESPIRKDLRSIVDILKPLRGRQEIHNNLLRSASLTRVAQISGKPAVPSKLANYCSGLLGDSQLKLNNNEGESIKKLMNYLYTKARHITETNSMKAVETGRLVTIDMQTVCITIKNDLEYNLMIFDTDAINNIIDSTLTDLNSAQFRGMALEGEINTIRQFVTGWRFRLPKGDLKVQHNLALETAEAHLQKAKLMAEREANVYPQEFQSYMGMRQNLIDIATKTKSEQIRQIIAQGINQIDRLVNME